MNGREWYLENRELTLGRAKDYYKKNRKAILQRMKEERIKKNGGIYYKVGEQNKGRKASEETKRKMSISQKRRKHPTGHKQTEEHKEKTRQAGLARVANGTFRNQYGGYKGGYQNKLQHVKRRRVQKLNIAGSHTLQEWEELKKKYNYMCLCCKRYEPEITLSEDHIVPITKDETDFILIITLTPVIFTIMALIIGNL